MLALGIEGTAHTYGAGVVRHSPRGDVEVLSNVRDMYVPPAGPGNGPAPGIHPREAANHHAEVAGDVLRRALAEAGVTAADVDLVAFSQGPGLGPCLRTAATTARALALAAGKPLMGVNHCVAHLEIGRAVTDAEDPVLLYASGGNTQVIAFTGGKYRVFGETLDVGVGNLLDKFAREVGFPFPGGPEVERISRGGKELLDLPHTIKGMDVAFSGILTAALAHVAKGAPLEDACFSLQETAFSMLVEVTERALAHTEKREVLLGGGVACNERLWEMTRRMCEARGARAYRPEKPLLVDNGAMIAHLGIVQFQAAGSGLELEETQVDQRQRTDDVEAPWRSETRRAFRGLTPDGYYGAEARVACDTRHGHDVVVKTRTPRPYRLPDLDRALRAQRVRAEARFLGEARRTGVRTPLVLEAHPDAGTLVLERLPSRQLKEVLDGADETSAAMALRAFGALIARLHAGNLLHGDLTTSNVLVGDDGNLVLLDFGLASASEEVEERGVDLHVLKEALEATHATHPDAFQHVMAGYAKGGGDSHVAAKLEEIERRGRYRGT